VFDDSVLDLSEEFSDSGVGRTGEHHDHRARAMPAHQAAFGAGVSARDNQGVEGARDFLARLEAGLHRPSGGGQGEHQ
jgi:hypothetical protein